MYGSTDAWKQQNFFLDVVVSIPLFLNTSIFALQKFNDIIEYFYIKKKHKNP